MEHIDIQNVFGKPVTISFQTINLGNGSPDEQESGILDGQFNGTFEDAGRTLRYEFDSEYGDRHYFFIDEIEYIEPAEARGMKTEEQLSQLAAELVTACRALDLPRMGRAVKSTHNLSPLELAAFRIALARAEASA